MATLTSEQHQLVRRAREIASGYRLILEPNRSGGFIGRVLELPRVFAEGRTAGHCLTEIQENAIDAVVTLLELGRVPPRPSDTRLTEQVNIRLAVEEKLAAETLALSQGFRGLADYVRSLLVKEIRR